MIDDLDYLGEEVEEVHAFPDDDDYHDDDYQDDGDYLPTKSRRGRPKKKKKQRVPPIRIKKDADRLDDDDGKGSDFKVVPAEDHEDDFVVKEDVDISEDSDGAGWNKPRAPPKKKIKKEKVKKVKLTDNKMCSKAENNQMARLLMNEPQRFRYVWTMAA